MTAQHLNPDSAPRPIVCDLGALSQEQRLREQTLLAEFRRIFRDPRETARGFRVVISPEPAVLARLGEFLALERLCCQFLRFDLSFTSEKGPITLHVHGDPGVKEFLRSTFFS